MKNLVMAVLLCMLAATAKTQPVLEHTFSGLASKIACFEVASGEYYYIIAEQAMKFLDMQYNVVSSVVLPKGHSYVVIAKRTLFDNDATDIEIAYVYKDNSNVDRFRIIKQDGTQLWDVPLGSSIQIFQTSAGVKLLHNISLWDNKIYSLPGSLGTGIKGLQVTPEGVTVYPNPVVDEVNMQVNLEQGGMVSILDMSGKLVDRVHAEGKILRYNASNLPAGAYVYMVEESGLKGRFIKN
jgi:hypothetical protein